MQRIIFGAALILFSLLSHAQVYTWTDENGKKHFSDKPPEQSNEKQVEVSKETYEIENIDASYPITDPNLYKDQKESYLDKKLRQREEKRTKAKVRTEMMANLCLKAKQRYAAIKNPVNFVDDNGRPIRVTEAERRKEEIELKRQIDEHC